MTDTKEANSRPESFSRNFIEKYFWDASAFAAWIFLIDSFILRIFGLEFFPYPLLLLASGIFPLFFHGAKREYGYLILYFPFLIFFPIISLWYLYQMLLLAKDGLISIALFFQSTSTAIGLSLSLLAFGGVQCGLIIFENKYLLLALSLVSLLLTLILVLPGFILSYDPIRPIKRTHEILIKFGKWVISLLEEYVIKENLRGRNYKEISHHLNIFRRFSRFVNNPEIDLNSISIVPKKVMIPMFSFFITVLFSIVIINFAGIFVATNKIAQNSIRPVFQISNEASPQYGLFKSLPISSSYFDCLFHSFTITTTTQDFSLQDTSPLGRILLCLQIFFSIFMVSSFVSTFFTIIGFENDFNLRLIDYVNALQRRFTKYSSDYNALLLPVRKEDQIYLDILELFSNQNLLNKSKVDK